MSGTRIIFVTYNYWPPQFGGELILSIERFQGLIARGFSVVVLTSGHFDLPAQEHSQGLIILRSPAIGKSRVARLLRRFVYVVWAFRRLTITPFDIYYQGDTAGVGNVTSALGVWLWTRVARWKHGRTVIVHSLADTEHKAFNPKGWSGFWRRFMFGCFDVVVAVSRGLYQDLKTVFPKSARLIVNGVRDDIFSPIDAVIRNRIRWDQGITSNDVVFAFLGTVGVRKGFDTLAQAFVPLAQKNQNWHLWVIGPYMGTHSQNLDAGEARQMMSLLKPVSHQVKYWGRIDDRKQLHQILAVADAFVFPSRREGMGLAPVEAMSAGVQVIVARIPGITDLANVESQTGLYVPVGDVTALKEAMEILRQDVSLRKFMGKKAADRVRAHFGWQTHLDAWQELCTTATKDQRIGHRLSV